MRWRGWDKKKKGKGGGSRGREKIRKRSAPVKKNEGLGDRDRTKIIQPSLEMLSPCNNNYKLLRPSVRLPVMTVSLWLLGVLFS